MEAAEAANAFRLMRGTIALRPDCGWSASELLGGCAMFGGAGSPVTHLMGGGMAGPVTAAEFDRLEEYFRSRGSPCLIDLCPLADLSVLDELMKRGYKVVEFNNLLARKIDAGAPPPPAGIGIRQVESGEAVEFTRLISRGFSPADEVDEPLVDALPAISLLGHSFVAIVEGAWAGGATVGLEDGVALFYGDATRAAWRGLGIQTALIHTRLQFARSRGADLAMATVLPGSASHRNYERAGFRLVYMRVNVSREWT